MFLCLQFSTGKGFQKLQHIVHSKKATGQSTATGAPWERPILCRNGHCRHDYSTRNSMFPSLYRR